MSFNLEGKIRVKDDGASKAFDKIRKATEGARKASDAYADANKRMNDAQERLSRGSSNMNRELNKTKKALDGASSSFGILKKAFAGGIGFGLGTSLVRGVGNVVGAAGDFLGDSVKKAMDFEAQMSTIKALTGASSAEMAKMQTLALEMGAATKYSAMDAAKGIEELLKAGLSPATVQAGGLEAALTLATAGGLDLAEASEIMSTALNSFKKDGLKAADAANILAGTANASATDVHDLRYSLAAVGAVADGAGMSFKDVNIALGLFANNGLKGSDAGTSLKSMLMNLSPSTNKATAQMIELGIMTKKGANAFYDAHGELKSLDKIAGILRNTLSKLTAKDRQDALREMFGSDGIRAANILFKEGAAGAKKFYQEMSNVTALSVAKEKMNNAAGAVEQFKGAIETLQISALLPTMPLITKFANAASDMVAKYTPQITAAVQSMSDSVMNYLNTNFFKNPEFINLPDIKSKVEYVLTKLKETVYAWWDSTGRSTFETLTTNVIQTITSGLEKSIPEIVSVGLKLGGALVNGVISAIKNDPVASAVILGGAGLSVGGLPGAAVGAGAGAAGSLGYQAVNATQSSSWFNNAEAWWTENMPSWITGVDEKDRAKAAQAWKDRAKPKAGGIDRVPYNQYPASLHAGEAVLTREEAKRYRAGAGGAPTVTITGNTFHVRQESDIDAIARRLAYHLAG
ncbi:phage tail tape measure protein [Paenibacillus sp. SN-8-1]|uniref:phage tail tape measure protein n=1 Tax=Paenibacillus sp. SN-8-1 TaxID=3435409 RepID=UPI003D9A1C47